MALPLRTVLADLYLDTASIRRVLSDATIDVSAIPFGGSAVNVWTEALAEARKQRKMRLLTNVVLSEYPDNPPLREAIESLLVARADGYVMYAPEPTNGTREDLRDLRNDLDKLRDHVFQYNEKNRKEISEERHKIMGLQTALELHRQATNLRMSALEEAQKRQERQLGRMARVEQRMMWIGVAMGFAAIVGQGILILVLRYFGLS